MVNTYMILQGLNNNNAHVLGYYHTLGSAKQVLKNNFLDQKNVFILNLKGDKFGEGFHQYTLELIGNKFKKNTRI